MLGNFIFFLICTTILGAETIPTPKISKITKSDLIQTNSSDIENRVMKIFLQSANFAIFCQVVQGNNASEKIYSLEINSTKARSTNYTIVSIHPSNSGKFKKVLESLSRKNSQKLSLETETYKMSIVTTFLESSEEMSDDDNITNKLSQNSLKRENGIALSNPMNKFRILMPSSKYAIYFSTVSKYVMAGLIGVFGTICLLMNTNPKYFWSLMSLLQYMFYILSLNLDIPENLDDFFEYLSFSNLDFMPRLINLFIAWPDLQSSMKFYTTNVNGNFLKTVEPNLVLFFLLGLIHFYFIFTRSRSWLSLNFEIRFQRSFPIRIYIQMAPYFLIAGCLQMLTFKQGDALMIISFVFAVLNLLVIFSTPFIFYYIISRGFKVNVYWKPLFEDYDTSKPKAKYFTIIDLVKRSSCVLLLVFLNGDPNPQLISMIGINSLYLLVFMIIKPKKTKFENYHHALQEVLVIIIHLFLIFYLKNPTHEAGEKFSYFIICFIIFVIVFASVPIMIDFARLFKKVPIPQKNMIKVGKHGLTSIRLDKNERHINDSGMELTCENHLKGVTYLDDQLQHIPTPLNASQASEDLERIRRGSSDSDKSFSHVIRLQPHKIPNLKNADSITKEIFKVIRKESSSSENDLYHLNSDLLCLKDSIKNESESNPLESNRTNEYGEENSKKQRVLIIQNPKNIQDFDFEKNSKNDESPNDKDHHKEFLSPEDKDSVIMGVTNSNLSASSTSLC